MNWTPHWRSIALHQESARSAREAGFVEAAAETYASARARYQEACELLKACPPALDALERLLTPPLPNRFRGRRLCSLCRAFLKAPDHRYCDRCLARDYEDSIRVMRSVDDSMYGKQMGRAS